MNKSAFFIFLAIFPLATNPVLAEHYELIKGKGVEVCEVYKKSLESLNEPLQRPCERDVNSNLPGFEKIIWHKVDLEKEQELFKRLKKYQVGTEQNQFLPGIYDSKDELQREIKFHKDRGYQFISRTTTDIDNDGKTDEILKYWDGGAGCELPNQFGVHLYILAREPGTKKAIIAATYPTQKAIREKISHHGAAFITENIFKYRNVTYIDKYCSLKNEAAMCNTQDSLIIYKLQTDQITEICNYNVIKESK